MVFKNRSESAQLLSQKIKEEIGADFALTYISPDSQSFAQLLANNLKTNPKFLPDLFSNSEAKRSPSQTDKFVDSLIRRFVIIDEGSTNSQEYNEFTDRIRKTFPQTKIIIAIPVIPESEKSQLEANCDTLIYLHADPYFFSINQFYQEN
ncbi:MAG: hypothetical protein WCV93_03530 [Candidatus Shapirobacteria bacterium]|jgi:predicted phosphoribosyltransferase